MCRILTLCCGVNRISLCPRSMCRKKQTPTFLLTICPPPSLNPNVGFMWISYYFAWLYVVFKPQGHVFSPNPHKSKEITTFPQAKPRPTVLLIKALWKGIFDGCQLPGGKPPEPLALAPSYMTCPRETFRSTRAATRIMDDWWHGWPGASRRESPNREPQC
jgi:hypothetical protein